MQRKQIDIAERACRHDNHLPSVFDLPTIGGSDPRPVTGACDAGHHNSVTLNYRWASGLLRDFAVNRAVATVINCQPVTVTSATTGNPLTVRRKSYVPGVV